MQGPARSGHGRAGATDPRRQTVRQSGAGLQRQGLVKFVLRQMKGDRFPEQIDAKAKGEDERNQNRLPSSQ